MTNRLATQTSPYLLQHAENPVDWYPWGDEALDLARRENRPILLSIGYAACHWCHVMERESFEDPETAALMNERFVCIKVDREERPDVDAIYMDAVQAMTGGGGWPLTAFLTPEGKPFYAGTYFPKEDRFGTPAFTKVLLAVADAWEHRRGEAESAAEGILQTMGREAERGPSKDPLSEDIEIQASAALRSGFDHRWGGFGGAPKFPQPMTLQFLLRRHVRGDPDALDMVAVTLDRMAGGGIHDQVGGGFHRYSTDATWHVPHFEKMLYDNAQLARLYTHAWLATREERFRRIARSTCDYLLREMRHPEGGFFSSQDADSEGVEGRFFVWSFDELVEAGSEAVATVLGAMPEGNWEGSNVLWRPLPLEAVASELSIDADDLGRQVEETLARLFEIRERRVRPATDDKVLAGWNGLAIGAFAEAGRAFGDAHYVEAAERAASFVLERLRDDRGRLLRSWRDGTAAVLAYADDHALLADGLLALSEATLESRWIVEARAFADELLRSFEDPERGGFFQTRSDAAALVVRPKDLQDNAVPSGNSAAAQVLLRLAHLTGDAEYERAGASALRVVREAMARWPSGFGHALGALDLYLGPVKEVAIVGDPKDPATRALADQVSVERFLPNHVMAAGGGGNGSGVELLRDRVAQDGRPTAYVCERFVCKLPVTEPDELAAQLSG